MEKNINKDLSEIKNVPVRILVRVLIIAVTVLYYRAWTNANMWRDIAISNQKRIDSIVAADAADDAKTIKERDERIKSQDSAIAAFKFLKR